MCDAPSFLFITTHIGSFSQSCDLLKISLIYAFPAPKNSGCNLIKQSNQPIHAFFSHLCTLSSIVLFPFALKQQHLRGQPSLLTALYLAFSLTYPDADFTCLVPILCILCPMGQTQKSCSSLL